MITFILPIAGILLAALALYEWEQAREYRRSAAAWREHALEITREYVQFRNDTTLNPHAPRRERLVEWDTPLTSESWRAKRPHKTTGMALTGLSKERDLYEELDD